MTDPVTVPLWIWLCAMGALAGSAFLMHELARALVGQCRLNARLLDLLDHRRGHWHLLYRRKESVQ